MTQQMNQPGNDAPQDIEAISVEAEYRGYIDLIEAKVGESDNGDFITKTAVKLASARALLEAGELDACFDKITETARMIQVMLGKRIEELDDLFLTLCQPTVRVPSVRAPAIRIPRAVTSGPNSLDKIREDMERKVGHLRRGKTDN
ncbi:hypothetical protein ACFL2V_13370 [Pseudomonadota bacterium]